LRSTLSAAPTFSVEAIATPVHNGADIEFALAPRPSGGLILVPDSFLLQHRELILSQVARSHLPAVFWIPQFVRDGGLLSYGPDLSDMFRRLPSYIDRILRGVKPSELAVQLPVKFEMAVNVKTAKELGLAVPQSILLSADEVIE